MTILLKSTASVVFFPPSLIKTDLCITSECLFSLMSDKRSRAHSCSYTHTHNVTLGHTKTKAHQQGGPIVSWCHLNVTSGHVALLTKQELISVADKAANKTLAEAVAASGGTLLCTALNQPQQQNHLRTLPGERERERQRERERSRG